MPWPLSDAGRVEQGGALTASSTLTVITASSTTHTKGSWTELLASTGFDASRLRLRLGAGPQVSTVDSSTLLDVGIGAALSEIVVVSNIPIGGHGNNSAAWDLPITVPAGARVAARIQSAVTSQTVTVQAVLSGGGFLGQEGYARATNYGADTATSAGTLPTVAGSTNTKSAWTQLSASIVNPIRVMLLGLAIPPVGTVIAATGLLDVGIGAAGSEVVIVGDVGYELTTAELIRYVPLTVPVNVAAGYKLSFRYQSTSTSTSARPSLAVIGFD